MVLYDRVSGLQGLSGVVAERDDQGSTPQTGWFRCLVQCACCKREALPSGSSSLCHHLLIAAMHRAFLTAAARSSVATASICAGAAGIGLWGQATCQGMPASGKRVHAADLLETSPVEPPPLPHSVHSKPETAYSVGVSTAKEAPRECQCMPCGVASLRAFDENAGDYDTVIGREEFFMGVGILRWWLLGEADGETLEVACGTARNLPHYKPRPPAAPSSPPGAGVTALTLVDASEGMLDKARVKARKHVHANGIGRVSLLCASAQSLPFEDGTFDTVVDTFGLCSMDDPESVLRELGRVCKPGGKVSCEVPVLRRAVAARGVAVCDRTPTTFCVCCGVPSLPRAGAAARARPWHVGVYQPHAGKRRAETPRQMGVPVQPRHRRHREALGSARGAVAAMALWHNARVRLQTPIRSRRALRCGSG